MSLFSWLGHLITSLFDKTKALFESLTETEQAAAKKASGIIAIINANLAAAPDEVFTLIQKEFPDVTREELQAVLNNASAAIGALSNVKDLQSAIADVQIYLNKFTGNKWIVITKSFVALVANELAPGSVIQKIELVIEWVYQTFFKGNTPVVTPKSGDNDGDDDADDGHPENGADGVGNHPVDPPPH